MIGRIALLFWWLAMLINIGALAYANFALVRVALR